MKREIIFALTLFVFLSINFVYAINIDVKIKPISDSYILEFNEPAIYDLTIKNIGESEEFEIYSLVGLDIISDKIKINSGETKTVKIKVMPQDPLKMRKGFFAFEYVISDSKKNVKKGKLNMNIISLSDIISVYSDDITLNSDNARLLIKNTLTKDLDDLEIEINSIFFEYKEKIPLRSLETKEIKITLDKEKLGKLIAGNYLAKVKIKTRGKEAEKEIIIRFLEEEKLISEENKKGFLIITKEIIKKNAGNVKKNLTFNFETNVLYQLFLTFNIEPTRTEIKNFKKYYTWEKEIYPGEEFRLIIKYNLLYPIFTFFLIIFLTLLIKKFIETDIIIKKRVSFVKAIGGEFALKIHLKVKAKRFVEKIKIIDKLPYLVSLYEKFGAISPNKIDIENRILEWDLESLDKDEERIFSYIIYSKIGIVGKFELPPARLIYKKEGKTKETLSNKAFFINEPKKQNI